MSSRRCPNRRSLLPPVQLLQPVDLSVFRHRVVPQRDYFWRFTDSLRYTTAYMESLPRVDLTGRPFGRFVVVGFHGRDDHGNALWFCKCSCGQVVPVVGYNLTHGTSTNCGCKRKETVSALRLKHGNSRCNEKVTLEYRAWANAKTATTVAMPAFSFRISHSGKCLTKTNPAPEPIL